MRSPTWNSQDVRSTRQLDNLPLAYRRPTKSVVHYRTGASRDRRTMIDFLVCCECSIVCDRLFLMEDEAWSAFCARTANLGIDQ
jgi:hypothetical protein